MGKITMKHKYTQYNQEGFASIVIAFVLVIVLSLITVGFAQLARREQQNALDRQLAKQAYYAAESGINDAYYDITHDYINASTPNATDASGCISINNPAAHTSNPTISTTNDVKYSCLLVALTPKDLVKDLTANNSWTISFSTNASIDSLTVTWSSTDGHNTFRSGNGNVNGFTTTDAWGNSPAVLEVSFTPLTSLVRANLISADNTVFLYPSSTGLPTTNYVTGYGSNKGPIFGSCSGTTCSATIQGIPSSIGPFLLHVKGYYDDSRIIVTATGGGVSRNFVNAQAQIDVTGKARNVLKRLQVRTPLNSPLDIPSYSLEAGNICKREQTAPTSTDNPLGTTYYDPSGSTASADPCNLQN